jgi:hypothetical protein
LTLAQQQQGLKVQKSKSFSFPSLTMDHKASKNPALTELLTQRRTGMFISAEEMDQRLGEMLGAKRMQLASRKD